MLTESLLYSEHANAVMATDLIGGMKCVLT